MTTILHRQPPMNGAHKAEDNSAVICRPDQPVSGENRRASMCRSGAYGKRHQATIAEPDSQFWRILLLLISHFTFPCDRFILLAHFIGQIFWSSCGSMLSANVFDQYSYPFFWLPCPPVSRLVNANKATAVITTAPPIISNRLIASPRNSHGHTGPSTLSIKTNKLTSAAGT